MTKKRAFCPSPIRTHAPLRTTTHKPCEGREFRPNVIAGAHRAEIQIVEGRLATLTGRENDVLGGLLKGQLKKITAHGLRISVGAVEVRRANVMAKMKARNLAELLWLALIAKNESV